MTLQACPRCLEDTAEGDHFEVADGRAYHVICYQAAMIEGDQPNPFPLCDYCQQLVWELDGPASLTIKGQTMDGGDWRPARWHVQCAPGEESPEYAPLPDRVDAPPPQPTPRGIYTKEELQAARTEADSIVRATGWGAAKPQLGAACTKCSKPVQRSLTVVNGEPYHKLCAAKLAKKTRQTRKTCVACEKKIPSHVEPVECETADGSLIYYHQTCYRKACLDNGQPDPFPTAARAVKAVKTPKVSGMLCSHCQVTVPREEFRAHVEEHERTNWAGA